MPELRRDPIVGRWVIISHRTKRTAPRLAYAGRAAAPCGHVPILSGAGTADTRRKFSHTDRTASDPDSPKWTVRVVPNKFPALHVEGDMGREGLGLYDRMNGIGAHEVIIETTNHKDSLAELPAKRMEDVLWAYRDRILDLKKDLRFRLHSDFQESRAPRRARRLEHSHSQLIAIPIVPTSVIGRDRRLPAALPTEERCIYCDIIRQESG